VGQSFETVVTSLVDLAAWRDLMKAVDAGRPAQVAGLAGGLSGPVVAALARGGRPVLVVSPGWREAQALAADVMEWMLPARVALLPPRPDVSGEVRWTGHEWDRLRMAAFRLLDESPREAVLVAPVEAVRQLMPPRRIQDVTIRRGDRVDRDRVVAKLVALGYERLPMVEQAGQFAVRGPILDIYPPGAPPFRVELFDDAVDLISVLDPATQRNGQALPSAAAGPAREMLWTPAERDRAVARITRELDEAVAGLHSTGHHEEAERLAARWGERLSLLMDGRGWPGMDRAVAAFAPPVPITAWFPAPPILALDDRDRVLEAARGRALEEAGERQRRLVLGDLLPVECENTLPAEALPAALPAHAVVDLSLLPHHRVTGQASLAFAGRPAPRAHGQWDLLVTELNRLRKSRHRVLVSVKSREAAEHLVGRLVDAQVPAHLGFPSRGAVGVAVGRLTRGFVLPELLLAVLSEAELTGREVRPEPVRRAVAGHAMLRLAELAPGDYVVHVTHGIGRFVGVATLTAGGVTGDYLHLQYANDDALYVPVEQLDVVQRYAGGGEGPPRLSKLGGAEWGRVKDRVRASVRDMAEQLIKLYAARESRPGFAFGPDTPWQRDFEDAFPYEETPDQLKATEEIKRDMERPRPMDRLLLGDVGYGKTEVALRAVFKAIMAGKQAAILVPTTLLAEQHYATARTRMAGFPINVGVMSRFQSPAEQRQTLAALADGQLDLVVGTHRLLSQDVAFKNLGLLVVDEEHRFGVAHKERIKALNETVDVLTLSATPIPRTLNMAMIGVRDWSVLETPPDQRFPVETVVAEYDESLIREAIRRELERQGQVYYVQNRIRAMDMTLARLRRMVPDARIAVAHGQMDEARLEDVMARFLAGEYDVLLATSIIESGLDIPNVNTMVVEDADRLGLAQLYQLRGRVGRSFRLAYAYFTVRRDAAITIEAERRLEAIRDFTELGAGYQIALRDLEIRGAGNLLGAEQHGFVAMVGFELYTQLLAEAVAELKGHPVPKPPETSLEFGVEAYLPSDYIADERQKIALYKRLVSATEGPEVDALAEEMEERFGPMPRAAADLVKLARIRVLARRLGLTQVVRRQDRVVLRLGEVGHVDGAAVAALASRYPGRLVQMPRVPELGFRLDPRAHEDVLDLAESILGTLADQASASA
jgi:transcription-repair coupling factor (superfamily II helicase)